MRIARLAHLLTAGLLLCILAACAHVPVTGRWQLMLVSPADEAQLGKQEYEKFLEGAKRSTDAAANAILQRVGERIAPLAHVENAEWEFTLVESDEVNAFALPGGKVVVFTGILPLCENEAGLAAVVGHEIAHVLARHGGERISQALMLELVLTGASRTLSKESAGTREAILKALGLGANIGVILPYSRTQEYEADLLGARLMARAGYDPREAPLLWKRMAEKSGDGALEFLSTHPTSEKRMAKLEEMMPDLLRLYEESPQRFGKGVALPVRRP